MASSSTPTVHQEFERFERVIKPQTRLFIDDRLIRTPLPENQFVCILFQGKIVIFLTENQPLEIEEYKRNCLLLSSIPSNISQLSRLIMLKDSGSVSSNDSYFSTDLNVINQALKSLDLNDPSLTAFDDECYQLEPTIRSGQTLSGEDYLTFWRPMFLAQNFIAATLEYLSLRGEEFLIIDDVNADIVQLTPRPLDTQVFFPQVKAYLHQYFHVPYYNAERTSLVLFRNHAHYLAEAGTFRRRNSLSQSLTTMITTKPQTIDSLPMLVSFFSPHFRRLGEKKCISHALTKRNTNLLGGIHEQEDVFKGYIQDTFRFSLDKIVLPMGFTQLPTLHDPNLNLEQFKIFARIISALFY
jgi:hypothetical protein